MVHFLTCCKLVYTSPTGKIFLWAFRPSLNSECFKVFHIPNKNLTGPLEKKDGNISRHVDSPLFILLLFF